MESKAFLPGLSVAGIMPFAPGKNLFGALDKCGQSS